MIGDVGAPLAWKFFATFAAENSKHAVLELNMLSGSSDDN
jgi:hypothetical protein